MRIEAISVCVGYHDFLSVTARHNRGLLDRWIVVTTPSDRATQEVCRRFDLDLLLTEEMTRDGQFAKGLGIQRAQRLLSVDSWRLHIDADIVLPANFRNALASADLDTRKIYGCDRVMIRSYQQWLDLLNSGYLTHQHDYHCRVCFPRGVEVGSRWASTLHGWCPVGFMQLWHADADEMISFQHRAYPARHGEASRSDTQHPLQWDRRLRELLPEIIVVHLESEEAPMGPTGMGEKQGASDSIVPPDRKAIAVRTSEKSHDHDQETRQASATT
jgi:hypothetical protein